MNRFAPAGEASADASAAPTGTVNAISRGAKFALSGVNRIGLHAMKPQTKHMIVVLKATIRGLGFTNREVERRLGLSRGYLTRLFSGVMDLRYDHVTEIADVIGVDPEDIFRLAYPPTPKPFTPAIQRLRDTIGSSTEVTPLSAGSAPMQQSSDSSDGGYEGSPVGNALEKELERIVARTFKKMFAGLEK